MLVHIPISVSLLHNRSTLEQWMFPNFLQSIAYSFDFTENNNNGIFVNKTHDNLLIHKSCSARFEQFFLRFIIQCSISRIDFIRMHFVWPIAFQAFTCRSIVILLSINVIQGCIEYVSYLRNQCNLFNELFLRSVTDQFAIRSSTSPFNTFSCCEILQCIQNDKYERKIEYVFIFS